MHTSLPIVPEISVGVTWLGLLVLTGLAVMLLLGGRYIFGKWGVTVVALAGVCLLGFIMLARTIAPVRVHVPEPVPITQSRTDVAVSTPLTGSTPSSAQLPSSAIQQIVGSNAPIGVAELPAWAKSHPHEGTLGAGYCKYVLTSHLYATPEEAESELNRLLAVDVQQSFTVGKSPAVGWSPTVDDLRMSGLVTEKVIETVPMKVGEFDTSVQRVSWLVEFKPASQQTLIARWETTEAQRRAKLVLTTLAALAGTFGVSAFALRRIPKPSAPPINQVA